MQSTPFPAIEDMATIKQSELNRLAQQLQDLRAALRPFATFAKSLPPIIPDQPRLTDAGPAFTTSPLGKNHIITFADLRCALALLDQLEAEDEARHVADAEEKMGKVRCAFCGHTFVQLTAGYTGPSYCGLRCMDQHEYWAPLIDYDFSKCCGGNDQEPIFNHCRDCDLYKPPPT